MQIRKTLQWSTGSTITPFGTVSKMLSSSVVFISVVFVIPTVSLTPDCRVTSSSTLTVKHRNLTTTFWGFINIVEERSFLSLRFYENGLPLLCIEYNHTHVTIHEIKRLDSTGRTSEPVPWPVCSEWRQFHLVVHRNILAITDDHNITWVSRNIHQSATHLELVMHHLKPSCTTPTPVWEVGANTQDIVAPRCQDALYFTFQANNTVTPQLTVGNVSLSLHQLSQSQPRLSLTVRGNPGATARVVGLLSPPHMVAVVWAMTVEVDCTLPTVSVSSENGGTFTLTQHIHLQECPPKTEKAQQGTTSCSNIL
ncbi:hypothetical protein O3P69_004476 [Scylla paramamosain]|uniref:Uncharacterized protein n=1 Tax=Scylla paramamosain TaxID=85552 RepID=A0AAW0UER6_SCYPA